ncbi:MAG: EF-P beta-lysylation protein EpmB [Cellvibrionales bacterium TMED49]|nr:EF-P beta-lysylation protein EpmB [Porticoccaceae bacterium]OUU38841.1 MAG: EF-P beta-lysylation protein EpmB [Cellvibrionales bacterium TMED49]|tara:strand:+ start:105 stop:1121 length:1017 start_codon:yes stop_codon:yes gene_type:complete
MHVKTDVIQIKSRWQTELIESVTSVEELVTRLNLSPKLLSKGQKAALKFQVRVPLSFIKRIRLGDPKDPLLLQILPVKEELKKYEDYSQDPLNELNHNPKSCVIHKYRNRVLLVVSSFCAINCRYCFRRHFPYNQQHQDRRKWFSALEYVSKRPEINEVIFSGGDPLAAKDSLLSWLSKRIAKIPHVKRLRIHTRLPVVIPSRIDDELLLWMQSTRLKPIIVLHINHPNEIDSALEESLRRLRNIGIRLLNQSVLLKNVNDCSDVLIALSEHLYSCEVTPYYLHLLDPVEGAAHFHVDKARIKAVYSEMQRVLPGFLLPRLVKETPGEPSKTIVCVND